MGSGLLGAYSDYVIIGLAAITVILLILYIVNVVQMAKLKKRYRIFMSGKNARNFMWKWWFSEKEGSDSRRTIGDREKITETAKNTAIFLAIKKIKNYK